MAYQFLKIKKLRYDNNNNNNNNNNRTKGNRGVLKDLS